MNKALPAMVAFACGALLAAPSLANPIPSYQLWEAIQDGQSAQVIMIGDDPSIETISLERSTGSDATLIVEKVDPFTLELHQYCDPSDVDEDACAEPDAECGDCDEDGTPECLWGCMDAYFLLDECLPAGESSYHLYLHGSADECWQSDSLDVVGEDVSQDCPPGESDFFCESSGDADSDIDSDSDTDGDTDDEDAPDANNGEDPGDCSFSGTPIPQPSFLRALFT